MVLEGPLNKRFTFRPIIFLGWSLGSEAAGFVSTRQDTAPVATYRRPRLSHYPRPLLSHNHKWPKKIIIIIFLHNYGYFNVPQWNYLSLTTF